MHYWSITYSFKSLDLVFNIQILLPNLQSYMQGFKEKTFIHTEQNKEVCKGIIKIGDISSWAFSKDVQSLTFTGILNDERLFLVCALWQTPRGVNSFNSSTMRFCFVFPKILVANHNEFFYLNITIVLRVNPFTYNCTWHLYSWLIIFHFSHVTTSVQIQVNTFVTIYVCISIYNIVVWRVWEKLLTSSEQIFSSLNKIHVKKPFSLFHPSTWQMLSHQVLLLYYKHYRGKTAQTPRAFQIWIRNASHISPLVKLDGVVTIS